MKIIIVMCIIFLISSNALMASKYELYRKRLVVGAMANVVNYYPGSSQYTSIAMPYIDFENKYFTIRNDKGILYRLLEDEKYLISIGVFYYVPRTSSMDAPEVFEGIHDVKFDIPLVSNNSIYLGKGFDLTFRFEQSSVTPNSQNYKTFVTYNKAITTKVFYEGSIGITFASKGYINNWFGISQEELANNTYFNDSYEFNKQIGVLNMSTSHYIYYDFSYDWSLLFGALISNTLGDVNKSPIIKNGSQIQANYMVSINYKF